MTDSIKFDIIDRQDPLFKKNRRFLVREYFEMWESDRYVIAKIGEKIIGYYAWDFNDLDETIYNILAWVHIRYRRRGICKKMIDLMVDHLMHENVNYSFDELTSSNIGEMTSRYRREIINNIRNAEPNNYS